MRKFLSWLLIIGGSATLFSCSINYFQLKKNEEVSLEEARDMFEMMASAQSKDLIENQTDETVEFNDNDKQEVEKKDTIKSKHTYGKGYGSEEIRSKWLNLSDLRIEDSSSDFLIGDVIGLFYVPRLNRELPIVEGTDERELEKGVGHFKGTGFPGQDKQILLSGHRDTVFRDFGELQVGDELRVMMEHGVFTYVIDSMKIVPADATDVIDFSIDEEVLTVSTCYPFSFIGWAPERYVIYAYPK